MTSPATSLRVTAQALAVALGTAALPNVSSGQEPARLVYHLDARSDGAYESNPQFVLGGGDAFSARINVGGELRRESRRSSASLVAGGSSTRYGRFPTLNRYGYLFGADLTHRFTERLAVRGSARATSTLSRGANTDSSGLFFFPLTLTRSRTASAGFGYRATSLLSADIGANYDRVAFADLRLSGGSLIASHAALTRHYSIASDVGLRLDVARNALMGITVDQQSLQATWQAVRARSALRLSGGAERLDSPADRRTNWRAIGDASLAHRVGPGLAAVRYSRSVSQVYGLGGVLASDVAGLTYGIASRHGAGCAVEVHRGWFAEPATARAPGSQVVSSGSTLFLRRPFGPTLGLEAQVFLRRNVGVVNIPTRGAIVSLTYRY